VICFCYTGRQHFHSIIEKKDSADDDQPCALKSANKKRWEEREVCVKRDATPLRKKIDENKKRLSEKIAAEHEQKKQKNQFGNSVVAPKSKAIKHDTAHLVSGLHSMRGKTVKYIAKII